ncbi:unnamed protein product [Zymoseptoria tritici ST99CH_1E4]|uniref:Uncharacterized protein n=1 Tax=Zymoseptoria tritici ST99CH_1E4 TaxID=1276532 RepID=A0A2H1FLJ4_ZYMTR|nr:unnamed protein product [Zymoseptoria tritici ST99CH_1E4]
MDIHRSRFVPYPTPGVNAVAFSRSSDVDLPKGIPQPPLKLALGRQNGDIEIWNPQQGKWVQETVLSGDENSVDGLLWTREADERDGEGNVLLGQYRLFSIATSPTVTEWDLAVGAPKRKSTGNFTQVWCFAAQPHGSDGSSPQRSPDLVAGTIDGAIVLLSTEDGDLQFKRFLARVSSRKPKCLSIAYQTRERVIAGFDDSSIKVLNAQNGAIIRTMSVGVGISGAPKNSMVWQVKCLPNGDIISGDSNGDVLFWSGRSYSLTQRVGGNKSEALDLVTSADGKTIFKGSLDGRITVLRHTTNPTGRQAWAKSHHRKIHGGEVKTMTAFDGKGMSVVVTGGSDKTAVVTPLREYGKEQGCSLNSLPQQSPVSSARQARLLVSWWNKTISIWRIARRQSVELSPEQHAPRKLVAQLQLDVHQSISSVAISDDGKLLAACTNTEVKIFQLRKRSDADALAIRKLEVPDDMGSLGARLVQFSPDGKWLAAVTPDNEVQVARIESIPGKPRQIQILNKLVELERQSRSDSLQSGFKQYERTVCRISFSTDSAVLVTADLAGYLDSWVLEGHEDLTAPAVDIIPNKSANPDPAASSEDDDSSDDDEEDYTFYGQHWAANPSAHLLPQLPSFPLVLSFRPSPTTDPVHVNGNPGVHSTRHNPHARSRALPPGPHHLWILTSTHEMYELDVLAGKLTDWSRANPTSVLPEDFTKLKDRAMGVVWDVSPAGAERKRERVWVYGSSWVCMLNVGGDLAPLVGGAKRRRMSEGRMILPVGKKSKGTSGAGPKMPEGYREGMPSAVRRIDGAKSEDVLLDGRAEKVDEDVEDDEEGETRLRLMRMESGGEDSQQLVTAEGGKAERKWWVTFKYRYILGMVPLADVEEAEDGEKALEVVLVERPLWEAEETK